MDSRGRRTAISFVTVALGLGALVACSADDVKESVISTLAIGSWACTPDLEETEPGYVVRIEDDGTLVVVDVRSGAELAGTWAIEDGDLAFGFDAAREQGPVVVEGFDALTLESTELTLTNAGAFETNDGSEDPADEQDLLVDVHSEDSVTFSAPGGQPWTCDRE